MKNPITEVPPFAQSSWMGVRRVHRGWHFWADKYKSMLSSKHSRDWNGAKEKYSPAKGFRVVRNKQ